MRRTTIWLAIASLATITSTLVCAQTAKRTPATNPIAPGGELVELWPEGKVPPGIPPETIETITDRTNIYGQWDRGIRGVTKPTLTVFMPKRGIANGTAVVVCPGGGYGNVVIDREGFRVAESLNGAGITAFVLKYRLPVSNPPAPGAQPPPVEDVQRALRLVRANAQRWGIDPNRVGVMGFSAGGHLAGTAATQFDAGDANSTDPVARMSCRPDFAALIYPVASMEDALAHKGSRTALIGEDADAALRERYSTDRRITPQTPPLFLVHARDDRIVNVGNSEALHAEAAKANVPCELHLYERGGHGFGVSADVGEAGAWFGEFRRWVKAPKTAEKAAGQN